MQIRDKVFIVTGAGNGIGREVALQILENGGHVALVDIDKEGLKKTYDLAKKFKTNKISLHQVDITKLEQVESLKNEVIKIHGDVDGLMNIAGIIQPFQKLIDLDYQKIYQVMNVNFYGTLYMIKTFLPLLIIRPCAHITNISSMGSFIPVPGQTIYGATKAAVDQLTIGLRTELKNTNVNVTLISPGAVATEIAKNSKAINLTSTTHNKNPKIKSISPKKAAKLIVNATLNNKHHVKIGNDAKFMYYLSRFVPNYALKIIYKKLS